MAKERTQGEPRAFEPINIRVYEDEDPDLIAYLKDKPKTWLIKTALRYYRDHKDKAPANKDQSQMTDAERLMENL